MDFGTNSVRLLVVRVDPNQSVTVIHKLKEMVRLGEGEFAQSRLRPEAMDRAVEAAVRFAQIAQSAGADEVVAVATAATREAENGAAFLSRLKLEAGLDVRVVSGQEEARLIYLGVASSLELGQKQSFFIDIGGGSTETIVGTQDEHIYLSSLKLGAIRLSNQFLDGVDGPVKRGAYERIRDYVRGHASRTLHELSAYDIEMAVGSSGTIESLADVAARMKEPRGDAGRLTYADLREAIEMLCSLPLEQRREVPGLTPGRADIVVGGAAILDVFMEELSIRDMRTSERGLRDGLLVDYLVRHRKSDLFSGLAPRERSVLQLGRTCRFDEDHARTTARLALKLFDTGREAGLHSLGDWERELLEYAALLHHIGSFLTFSGYQKHGHYLVRNAELLGFDQLEIAMISLVVLYHRSSLPRKSDVDFAALPSSAQRAVSTLSALVRLAENLDRSQSGNIAGARLVAAGRDNVRLEVEAVRDPQVELGGIENQRPSVEKILGVSLEVRVVPPEEPESAFDYAAERRLA